MIENALNIMLFMWCVSFSVFGIQFVVGDVLDVDITNYRGEPVRSHLAAMINTDQINQVTVDIIEGDYQDNSTEYDKVEDYGIAAAFVAWELILLLSGTYIFSFLHLMGVPLIFVSVLVILYLMLLARAIVGYIRGV